MNADVESLLRTELAERAERVVADPAWQRDVASALERGAIRGRRRNVQLLVAAGVAIALGVTGAWALRRDPAPSPAPAVPEVATNAELIELMPQGGPADTLVVQGGFAYLPGRSPIEVGQRSVVGRAEDAVLVGLPSSAPDGSYRVVVRGHGRERSWTLGGPNALSPDGSFIWQSGDVFETVTGVELAGFGRSSLPSGLVSTVWTDRGLVFETYSDRRGTRWWLLAGDDPGSAPSGPASDVVPLSIGESLRRQPEFAVAGDRVLVDPDDGCAFVGAIDDRGRISSKLSDCDHESVALSPDGSTVLVGSRGTSAAPPWIGTVTGLRDVDSGTLTPLPWLEALDEFATDDSFGSNLYAYVWEDGDTVLLAYYVSRGGDPNGVGATVRLARCSTGEQQCETAPGELDALFYPQQTIFGS